MNNNLFTETLRPKNLQQIILLDRIRNIVNRNDVSMNFLIEGTQGCGKTTLTRILAQNFSDVLEINASLQRGIDVIRDEIVEFASSASLLEDGEKKLKLVILEECDGFASWSAMRAVMEKYHKNVRFIANCNYIDKIPAPILSRFTVLHLEPINKEEEMQLIGMYVDRTKLILDKLSIAYNDSDVASFVKINFPDMRSIVSKIQTMYTSGAKELTTDMLTATFDCSDLFKMILSAPDGWNNYKFLVTDWSNRADDAVAEIGKNFVEYMHTVNPQKDSKIPQCIIAIAEHQNMMTSAIDKFIVLESLVFKLQVLVNS